MIKVVVTEEDIQRGKRLNREKSPINYALRRTELKDNDIFVYSIYIIILDGREYEDKGEIRTDHTIKLPQEAIRFNYDFDNGLEVKPFEFELEYSPILEESSEIPVDNAPKSAAVQDSTIENQNLEKK